MKIQAKNLQIGDVVVTDKIANPNDPEDFAFKKERIFYIEPEKPFITVFVGEQRWHLEPEMWIDVERP